MILHIFGGSGSGTSTLGRAIAEKYGYVFLDTDDYFWMPTDPPFQQKRPQEERLALLRKEFSAYEKVVLSGSLCGWGDPLIPSFDLAVRIELPQEIRLERLQAREFSRFGSRILPGGDMEQPHQEFMDWAARYDTGGLDIRSRALHDEWQKKLRCPLIELDGSLSVEQLIAKISSYL